MFTRELSDKGADIDIAPSRKYQWFLPNAARFMPHVVELKEYLPAKQLKKKEDLCLSICYSEHISFLKLLNLKMAEYMQLVKISHKFYESIVDTL